MSNKVEQGKEKFKEMQTEANIETETFGGDVLNVSNELRQYKQLLDDGIITQEDFDSKKKQLFGI